MKIFHTSDWHLGRMLYGKKRYQEFEAFLDWLALAIKEHQVDVLLVAGDIFDTSTPSNRSQELYYRFLCQVAASTCRHVVIIAGNHDSPSFLNAPKDLLKALDVHVVGGGTANIEDEVIVLHNQEAVPELIVCAVPYLRDKDIRISQAGESMDDKELKQTEGIRQHYAKVAELAEQKRHALGVVVPIIGMGHLFTAGGTVIDGDGVRELYVGSLARVTAAIFPACFDYVALGHLHVPQCVAGSAFIRYSGSPIPMGFGEAKQQKSLCSVTIHPDSAQDFAVTVDLVEIPVFQKLERLKGNHAELSRRLLELSVAGSTSWLEVIYEGDEVIGHLPESSLEILRIKNNRLLDRSLEQTNEEETLDDLDPNDVFKRLLIAHDIPENQHKDLLHTYQETLLSLSDDDLQAQ